MGGCHQIVWIVMGAVWGAAMRVGRLPQTGGERAGDKERRRSRGGRSA